MKLCPVLVLCLATTAPSVHSEIAPPPQPVPVQVALPDTILEDGAVPLPLAAARKPQPGYLGLVLGSNLIKPGDPADGVMVEDVLAASPAAAAGALIADVVTAVDAAPVNTPTNLVALIRAMPIGKKVTLHILRKGQPLIIAVTLGAPPVPLTTRVNTPVPIGNYVVIADTGALADPGQEITLLPGGLVPSPNDTPIRVAVPLPAQPIGSMPGDQPIVPVEAHGRPAYLSGQVFDATDSPASNITVTAYAADGNSIAAITKTLVNGAYALRLPGPGNYRVEVAAGGSARQQMVEVPAAGLQGLKLSLSVQLRRQPQGYLGVTLGVLGPALVAGIVHVEGIVTVEDVAIGSAGEQAGIQVGDTITALNGVAVTSPAQFSITIGLMKPGREILLGIVRKGQKLKTAAKLGAIIHQPNLQTLDLIEREDILTTTPLNRNTNGPVLLDEHVERLKDVTTF